MRHATADCPRALQRSSASRWRQSTSRLIWRVAPCRGRKPPRLSPAVSRPDAAALPERWRQPEQALAAAQFLSASALPPASLLRPAAVLLPAPSTRRLASPPPPTP